MATNTTVKRATLFDPVTGDRKAVDVGGMQAQQLFGQGYQLETPTNQYSPNKVATPLPVQPGERDALINKYVQGGYSQQDASRRVDELWANRPVAQGPTPPSLVFAPTGEKVSTAPTSPTVADSPYPTQVLGSQTTVPPAPTIPDPTVNSNAPAGQVPGATGGTSFQAALLQLLQSAQGTNGNQDLFQRRNDLINQRFNAISNPTPDDLRVLPPAAQAALRQQDAAGITNELAGVGAAMDARNAKLANLKDLIGLSAQLFSPNLQPASVNEYKYAVASGYGGSYTDFLKVQKTPVAVWSPTYTDAAGNLVQSNMATNEVRTVTNNATIDNPKITRITTSYENSPTIKQFQNIGADAAVAKSIPDNTADPQQQMLLLAKFSSVINPAGMVRQNTIEDIRNNAQSIAAALGMQVGNVLNRNLLTPQAVQRMKAAIAATYDANLKVVNAYRAQSVKQINDITGRDDGDSYLTDWAAVYADPAKPEDSQGSAALGATKTVQQLQGMGLTNDQILEYLRAKGVQTKPVVMIPGKTLAAQNSNPGNLRLAGQPGATQGAGGFAKFQNPTAGYLALRDQIALDATRGHTLASFISKYAPPSENNTNTYIQQAARALGINPNTKLSQVNVDKVAAFMAKKESSTVITYA